MLGDDLLVAEGGPAVLARLLQKGRQRAVARGDEEQLAWVRVRVSVSGQGGVQFKVSVSISVRSGSGSGSGSGLRVRVRVTVRVRASARVRVGLGDVELARAHVSEPNLLSVCIGALEGGRLPRA